MFNDFNRRASDGNISIPDNKFWFYIVDPKESGRIISARGPGSWMGRDPAGVLVIVLPPIEEFGEGMVFTIKAGGFTEINLFSHEARPHAAWGDSYTYEYLEKGYFSYDYFGTTESYGDWGKGTGHDSFIGSYQWPAHNAYSGYSNATIQLTSIHRQSDKRGGLWLVTQDELGFWSHPYYWTPRAYFDWYMQRELYPPDGPAHPGVAGWGWGHPRRHAVQHTYFTQSDPSINWIEKDFDYVLDRTETGAVCTNLGATQDTTFTLPSAEEGLHFTFIQKTANYTADMHIRANNGDYIQIHINHRDNMDMKEIKATPFINSAIYLVASDDRNWHYDYQIPEWLEVGEWISGKHEGDIEVPGVPGDMVTTYSVTAAQDGTFFTNSGNCAHCHFTLPTASKGLEYQFQVGTSVSGSFAITISGQLHQKIHCDGSVLGYNQVTTSGYLSHYHVKAIDGTSWRTVSSYGDWSVV